MKTQVRRVGALLVLMLFAVLSIGAQDCFGNPDSTKPPSDTYECCPGEQIHYLCKLSLNMMMTGTSVPEVRCFEAVPCSGSEPSAEAAAWSQAKLYYGGTAPPFTMTQIICAPMPKCLPTSAFHYQDYPGLCPAIMNADAGPPMTTSSSSSSSSSTSGGPSCLANNDACANDASCCSGICSDWGACEACRMTGEGCVNDSDCCTGICSLNACGG